MSCEKKTCPKTCTEPFGPISHCCLDCQNNEVMGMYFFLSHLSKESIALCSIPSGLQQGFNNLEHRKKLCDIILPLLRKYKIFYAVYRSCIMSVVQSEILWDGIGGQNRGDIFAIIGYLRLFGEI